MTNTNDLAALRKTATAQGWRIVETRKGETWYPPETDLPGVTVHGSESDHRALRNTIARLRRSGLKV